MRHVALIVLVSATAMAAVDGPRSNWFSVTTAVTTLSLAVPTSSTSIRIDNNGSNPIWCRYRTTAEASTTPSFVAGQGMKVAAGNWASFPAVTIYCIAETASQTGCDASGTDCTWLTEVP